MKIKLSKEALGKLPAADSQGLSRVSATVRITGPDEVELMELGDFPVGGDGPTTDDQNPMTDAPPIPDDAPTGLY